MQRKRAGGVLDALKAAAVPAKSYYEESQLETDDAQMHFAGFKLLLNKGDRVALRYLMGVDSPNFWAGPYTRVRAHCEETGDSPCDTLEKLWYGTLTFPHTKPLVEHFE